MESTERDVARWTTAFVEGRTSRRRLLQALLASGLSMGAIGTILGECGAALAASGTTQGLRIFMVPKFTGFVYFELARAGALQACKELGAHLTYVGTTTADVEGQVQVFQNILAQRPDGIVTASLDLNAPVPALRQARQQGTVVVTFDADTAPDGRDMFVNMLTFPKQAQAMLDAALANAPGGGPSIWIAPTPTVANFISQKKALDELIKTTLRYKNIHFIDTLYANDDPEKSYSVGTDAMQAHPNLKLFITGSGISNPAINKAIEATGRVGKVYSTGFALPSTMKTYLNHGTCKEYALWDPKTYGYMATYACILLKAGKVQNKIGDSITVPKIGTRRIISGYEVDYNEPLFFTKGHDDFGNGLNKSM